MRCTRCDQAVQCDASGVTWITSGGGVVCFTGMVHRSFVDQDRKPIFLLGAPPVLVVNDHEWGRGSGGQLVARGLEKEGLARNINAVLCK